MASVFALCGRAAEKEWPKAQRESAPENINSNSIPKWQQQIISDNVCLLLLLFLQTPTSHFPRIDR
jgi:hypothetical protein